MRRVLPFLLYVEIVLTSAHMMDQTGHISGWNRMHRQDEHGPLCTMVHCVPAGRIRMKQDERSSSWVQPNGQPNGGWFKPYLVEIWVNVEPWVLVCLIFFKAIRPVDQIIALRKPFVCLNEKISIDKKYR